MRIFWAYVRRYFHCLFHFHRAGTMWVNGKTLFVVCADCKKVFYLDKKTWTEKYQNSTIFDIWVHG